MLRKVWLSSMSIIAVTILAEGSFVMTKGESLKKINVEPTQSQSQVRKNISIKKAPIKKTPTKKTPTTSLGKLIYKIDFNKRSQGAYTPNMCKEDFLKYKNETPRFGYCTGPQGGATSIIKDNGENVLRVKYKANSIHATGSSGFIAAAPLPKKIRPKEDVNHPQTVTLVYYVKFEKGFDWVISGKLPGLAGGTAPTGGEHSTEGFSARFSWYVLSGKNSLISYLYVHDVPGKYGLEPTLSKTHTNTNIMNRNKDNIFEFVDNRWYKLQESITPNTPKKANGKQKIWIDGVLAANFKNIKFIADGKHGQYTVDKFLFSTFHGGGTMIWAPKKEEYSRFKDIKIYVK